jgi:4-hydroxybenzoate polyprenyltransferase
VNAPLQTDWSAWWQILRAANVFTAISNVIAGFLLVQGNWQPFGPLLLLMLTSALLYEAGMLLNDVCDADLDAKERPERPIPSGRIAKSSAKRVGSALLLGGVTIAIAVSVVTSQWQTNQIALALAATIVGYNVGVKSTRFGPLAMGGCRMMNVLLGASVAGTLTTGITSIWLFAWGVFFHTYGLTRIARQEANSIDNVDLWIGAAAVILCPLWIAGLPITLDQTRISTTAWIVICIALLISEAYLAYQLIYSSDQAIVRSTIGTFIKLFIVIDAAVSALAAGWLAGLAVLSLLLPTWLMARRIPMT